MDQQVTISPPAFQIIKRGAFTVLGVEEEFALIERDDPGFVKIWLERFEAKHDLVRPLSIDKAYYGIFFYASERVWQADALSRRDARDPHLRDARRLGHARDFRGPICGLRDNTGADRRYYRPRGSRVGCRKRAMSTTIPGRTSTSCRRKRPTPTHR